MIVSFDQVSYLRAQTDCLLGVLQGEALEFYGPDAEKVAEACAVGFVFRCVDGKGAPLAVCTLPARLIPPGDQGDPQGWILRFDAAFQDAICGAGYPFAVACALPFDCEDQALRILTEFRPRLGATVPAGGLTGWWTLDTHALLVR